jgi:uncharacterized membrane protein
MEAFSDAVIAILMTIMVLELHAPAEPRLAALWKLAPVFLSYVLSFVYLGIYWNNHHHLLQATERVNGKVLWANLHLLFWLSLIPFGTAWMGESAFAMWPVVIYGTILLLAGFAYYILAKALVALHGQDSRIALALGADRKGLLSLLLYLIALGLAFLNSWLAVGLYFVVALIWLIPDSRIERQLAA